MSDPGGTRSQDPRSPALGFLPVALDRFSDGIVVLGRDWRCRYLNERASAMLGRPVADIVGRQIWRSLPKAVGRALREACESAAAEGRPTRLVAHDVELGGWLESRIFPHDGGVVIVVRDVTDEWLAHHELTESVDRLSEAEQIVGFGVWEWEIASGRVRWSDELHRIYGLQPGDFGGTVDAFMEYLHPEDRDRVWQNIAHSMETLEPFVFEERITRADGVERMLLSQGRVIADSGGEPGRLVGVCHDVTDRARIERELGSSERRMRAIIDHTPSIISVKDLSGCYLMSNAESGRVLGMRPEDIVGKQCADLFPADIAAAQRTSDRRAVSEGLPVFDEVALIARNGELRNYVVSTFVLPDENGLPAETCTIGTDVTERREYESGRRERAEWIDRISSALAEDRMEVFAQPIIALGTGVHAFSELLVRMRPSALGAELLSPSDFLPAAERFGLIQSIDIWMVRQATVVASDVMLGVNLSAVTMSDPAARRQIVDLLEAAPAAARRIVFEITETAAAGHVEAAGAFAREVERLGCRLALDDFGTGFGSFTYLRTLPLSYIKIDLSFVLGLTESLDDRRVVQSIIALARQFGLATVAEGVENEATLELLRELGADYAQGFHLGRPAPLRPPRG